MKAFDLVKATSLDEAVSALGGEGAMAIAGGTDVINTLQDRVLAEYPKTLVSLKSIPNLDYIKEEGGS
jgi:CO/xanthine dehydrogenase FAD-binding subunit